MQEVDGVFYFSGRDVALWVDKGACVHLKAVTPFGDPVELNAEEVRELGNFLLQMVASIE